MEAYEIRYHEGKYKFLFELPYGYGYTMMLKMSQYVIDDYFDGKILSFRLSLLPGQKEKEYKFILKLYKNRIEKCSEIQKENGVLYLRGRSPFLEDEIEIVWFNQTNRIGVVGNFGDKDYISKVEMMLDEIYGSST